MSATKNLPLETAHGRRIEVEFVSNVYLVNHQKVIQCSIRDISERKRMERALHESSLELQHKERGAGTFSLHRLP